MAEFFSELDESLQQFISEQNLFFTASASKEGRINLSPKGMNTFRCVDNNTVAYLDLTGSGNSTAAHLLDDGRMTIMFCSFLEEPLCVRLYGQGKVIHPRDQDWDEWHSLFESMPGERQIIVLKIESVQTSCGYAVPIYEFKRERKKLIEWAEEKGKNELKKYWESENQTNFDGLPTKILKD